MELKRIGYGSALFVGVLALVIYLISGIVNLIVLARIPELQAQLGAVNPLQILVMIPLIGGVIAYLIAIVSIAVYNFVARAYPINWTLRK